MIIHRYLFTHYRQVAVYFWPILFWNLWRVDRWSETTGRQAFVQVDRYGRAWVPYFEGMGRNYMTHDPDTRFYAPGDVEVLCPQIFANAIAQFTADASDSWGPGTILSKMLAGTFLPWAPAFSGVEGLKVHLDPASPHSIPPNASS